MVLIDLVEQFVKKGNFFPVPGFYLVSYMT